MELSVLVFVISGLALLGVDGLQDMLGNDCDLAIGSKGVCRRLRDCPHARQAILAGGRPQICQYERTVAIVCCPTSRATTHGAQESTTQRVPRSTSESAWYWKTTTRRSVASRPQPARHGRSWQKCREYAKAVFRKVQDPVLLFEPESVLVDQCAINDRHLSADGVEARHKEFPHMAALGYGDPPNVDWLCGASLISDKFVLTAASCIYSKDRVQVKWVRFGDLNPSDKTDTLRPQTSRVAKAIPHPRYKPTSLYHDIALIRLRGPVKFDASVRPACLNAVPSTPPGSPAVATGWGAPSRPGGRPSQELMKFGLKVRSAATCNATYKSLASDRGRLAQGFAEDSMLCVGDPANERDTCVGFSGDPLQRVLTDPYCMHSVLGVSSFGKEKCANYDVPAVYTRVSHYLPWIESIVWP